MAGACQGRGRCTKTSSKLGLAAVLVALSTSAVSLAHDSPSNSIKRWAAGAILTAWDGTPYRDRTCFDAAGISVPCAATAVVQMTEETGMEYAISLGNRTEVPLNCCIRGGRGGVASFSLLTKGANHVATVQVPSTARPFFEVVCEASVDQVLASSSGSDRGRVRISVLHDVQSGKTTRVVTVR